MKKINPEKEDDVINVHPSMKNLLSHRVFPIPPRMLFDLWDYGSLAEGVEEKYIRAMLSSLKLKSSFLNCFVSCVIQCQNYIKVYVEKEQSSVSLRDIKRVIRIFKFYYFVLWFRNDVKKNIESKKLKSFQGKHKFDRFEEFCKKKDFENFTFEEIDIQYFKTCYIITIFLNYIFRIPRESKFTLSFAN